MMNLDSMSAASFELSLFRLFHVLCWTERNATCGMMSLDTISVAGFLILALTLLIVHVACRPCCRLFFVGNAWRMIIFTFGCRAGIVSPILFDDDTTLYFAVP